MTLGIKALLWVILACFSGVLYHLGGCGKGGDKMYPRLPKWLWGKVNGKLRDWSCSLCLIACLWLFKGFSWLYFPTFILSWFGLSAYWKFGKVDMKWWNWAMHGLFCGLAALPLIWCGVSMVGILIRSLLCAITMTCVSEFSEDVRYEEFMRGVTFTLYSVFLI